MGYLEIIMKNSQGTNLSGTRGKAKPKIDMKKAMKAGVRQLTKDVK